jgi:transposase
VILTPGQAHDLTGAQMLLDDVDPHALIGDKAYDADSLLDTLAQRDIAAVIPPKTNRKTPRTCDFALYCERNLVERFFNKLKHFRAIATRYDKLARNFLAGVQLACAIIPGSRALRRKKLAAVYRLEASVPKRLRARSWTKQPWRGDGSSGG